MALNINGTTGISGVDGSASAPALQGTDSNTGLSFGSDTVNINTGGSTKAVVSPNGCLIVGGTSESTLPGQTHFLQVGEGNGNCNMITFEKTDTVNIARMEIRINRNSATSIQAFHTTDGQAGNITITGTSTAYNTSSDYRLKENVVSISDGITRLKTLKPYRFNFKTDSTRTVDGFYAHEVTAVPEAITGTKDATNADGSMNPQSIDQSKLVPLLTAALQEAIAKIEVLETKVAALEAG